MLAFRRRVPGAFGRAVTLLLMPTDFSIPAPPEQSAGHPGPQPRALDVLVSGCVGPGFPGASPAGSSLNASCRPLDPGSRSPDCWPRPALLYFQPKFEEPPYHVHVPDPWRCYAALPTK